jgi:SAM-dependent methyltransferase
VELELVITGRVERLTLVDVSEESLGGAKAAADSLGIGDRVETVCATFETFIEGITPGSLDAVTFISSLHHIDDVNEALRLVRRALRPGGVVIGSEYVGPNRFAFPADVRAIADEAYRSLPSDLRGEWPVLPSPDPVEVATFDPSEAVDSERIIDAVRETFPDHEILEMGGAIVHLVWYGVDHAAIFESEHGAAAVQQLIDREQELMTSGVLPSYFARFIGRA